MGQLKYKGYTGSVEYCAEDNSFYGKVLGMGRVGITYLGKSADELKADFEGAVDFYLETCAEEGTKPLKPYSGKLNLRMSSELHQKVAMTAMFIGESINDYINATLERDVERVASANHQLAVIG